MLFPNSAPQFLLWGTLLLTTETWMLQSRVTVSTQGLKGVSGLVYNGFLLQGNSGKPSASTLHTSNSRVQGTYLGLRARVRCSGFRVKGESGVAVKHCI